MQVLLGMRPPLLLELGAVPFIKPDLVQSFILARQEEAAKAVEAEQPK